MQGKKVKMLSQPVRGVLEWTLQSLGGSNHGEQRDLIATLTFKEVFSSFYSPKFSLLPDTSTPFLSHLLTLPWDNLCASWLSLFLAQLSWNCPSQSKGLL